MACLKERRYADGEGYYAPYRGRRGLVPRGERDVYLINGMNTTFCEARDYADALRDVLQHDVMLVYSEKDGFAGDLFIASRAKLKRAGNIFEVREYLLADSAPAALLQSIVASLTQGRQVWIYAHSRGAIFTANVVNAVIALAESWRLTRKALGLEWLDSFSRGHLSRLHVRTLGGAAVDIADKIDVRHYQTSTDIVSVLVGMRGFGTDSARTVTKDSVHLVEWSLADRLFQPFYAVYALAGEDEEWDLFSYQWMGRHGFNFEASHNFVNAYMLNFFQELRTDFATK